MAQIQPDKPGSAIVAGVTIKWNRHRVKVKSAWTGEWKEIDYLEAISFTDCCAPQVPSAVLIYHAGRIKREDTAVVATVTAPRLSGFFLRIELLGEDRQAEEDEAGNEATTPVVYAWTGVIAHSAVAQGGKTNSSDIAPSLTTISAYGLEHLLDQIVIRGSYVRGEDDGPAFVETVIPFNQRLNWGLSEIGNSTITPVPVGEDSDDTVHIFDGSTNGGGTWSVYGVIEHILKLYCRTDLQFTIGGQANGLDEMDIPQFNPDGMTVKQVLDELINPSRGCGYCIRVHDEAGVGSQDYIGDETPTVATGGTAEIHVFSIADKDLSLASQKLLKNAEIAELNVTGRLDVVNLSIERDDRANYGKIIASGEPLLVCGTFSYVDSNLVAAWTQQDQTDYVSVEGSGADEKDANRKRDELRHVWSVFRVPATWDFTTGNGDGGPKSNANPALKNDGTLDTSKQAEIRRGWGLKFERNVPFFKPKYTENMKPDWRDAIGYIKDPNQDDAYIYLDALPAHVRLLDNELGFEITTEPAHLLGKEIIGTGTETPITTNKQPVYNWRTLAFTAAYRTDQRLRVIHDVTITKRPGEENADFEARKEALAQRVLHIDVPGAELWYAVPETAETIHTKTTEENAKIRNDVDKVRRAALAAAAWYGTSHATVQLSIRTMLLEFPVGSMISRMDEVEEINAIVTSKTFNLREGTTTLSTTYEPPKFGANRRDGWGSADDL